MFPPGLGHDANHQFRGPPPPYPFTSRQSQSHHDATFQTSFISHDGASEGGWDQTDGDSNSMRPAVTPNSLADISPIRSTTDNNNTDTRLNSGRTALPHESNADDVVEIKEGTDNHARLSAQDDQMVSKKSEDIDFQNQLVQVGGCAGSDLVSVQYTAQKNCCISHMQIMCFIRHSDWSNC